MKAKNVEKEVFVAAMQLAKQLTDTKKEPRDLSVTVGEHPEGSKRGGYVPVYQEEEARVYWDEGAVEWFAYDNDHSTDE